MHQPAEQFPHRPRPPVFHFLAAKMPPTLVHFPLTITTSPRRCWKQHQKQSGPGLGDHLHIAAALFTAAPAGGAQRHAAAPPMHAAAPAGGAQRHAAAPAGGAQRHAAASDSCRCNTLASGFGAGCCLLSLLNRHSCLFSAAWAAALALLNCLALLFAFLGTMVPGIPIQKHQTHISLFEQKLSR